MSDEIEHEADGMCFAAAIRAFDRDHVQIVVSAAAMDGTGRGMLTMRFSHEKARAIRNALNAELGA